MREYLVISEEDPRSDVARYCLAKYYAELGARFEAGFDVARSRDPDLAEISRPRGAFLVARASDEAVGCVALKGSGGETAEVKRLWVSPPARGQGVARLLMAAVENAARELRVQVLRLDTNRALPEALAMYRRAGWKEIERFNDDPYAHHFFEKRL